MSEKAQDLKPDFGEDRSIHQFDRDQIYTDMAKVIDEFYEPKGILQENKKLIGVILKRDTGPNPENPQKTKEEFYHVFVQNVHFNKVIPLALKNLNVLKDYVKKAIPKNKKNKGFFGTLTYWAGWKGPKQIPKDLKQNVLDRAFEVYIANDFNDGTSYMSNPKGFTLPEGIIVNIKYDSVVGGVPSKGKIEEILFAPDGNTPLFADETFLRTIALGTDDFTVTALDRPVVDLRLPSVTNAAQDKTLQILANRHSPCKNIIANRKTYRDSYNHTGPRLHFDYECKDFKRVIESYAQKIRTTRANPPNLLQKNGLRKGESSLADKIKEVLNKEIPQRPFFMSGVGEYTPKWAYQRADNRAKIPTAKLGKKSYLEYYKGYITDGGAFKQSYDCSGIGSYLAFHLGFLPGTKNYKTTGLVRTAKSQGEEIATLEINVKQFAVTPGAACVTNNGTHVYWSAGEGFKPYKGKSNVYEVNVYEASNFGIITRKKKMIFKETKTVVNGVIKCVRLTSSGKIYNKDTPNLVFGILPSFVYASERGLFIGSAQYNAALPAGKKAARNEEKNRIYDRIYDSYGY